MNFEEFLQPDSAQPKVEPAEKETVVDEEKHVEVEDTETSDEIKLAVSETVVEEFAAETAQQKEIISSLRKELNRLQSENASLRLKIAEQDEALAKVGETLAKNAESAESSKIALLDRNMELQDRFEGEARDQVLEVIREARDIAEKDGRIRRAQILEAVMLANEPNGTLVNKRTELEKLFINNSNVITGSVIEELKKLGISHKNGEEYLLPSEILKRVY